MQRLVPERKKGKVTSRFLRTLYFCILCLYCIYAKLQHGAIISIDPESDIEHILYGVPKNKKTPNVPPTWWRGTGRVQNASHPHLGARSWKDGGEPMFQMIVDPSPQRLGVPKKNFVDSVPSDVLCPNNTDIGIEQKGGNDVLLKVKRGIQKCNKMVPGGNGRRKRKSKILCMIYTVDIPKSRANLKAQSETWGRKCDGFFAASNVTDHSIGAIDLVHQGEESYNNMWQKIRSMWAYAHDHYLNDYDFFHIGGDDVYLVVENLPSFLDGPDVLRLENGYLDEISNHHEHREMATKWASRDYYNGVHGLSARPLYFGSPGRYRYNLFPCGGAGYTLNRAALEHFGKVGIDSFKSHWISSEEDVIMGMFFNQEGISLSHVSHNLFNSSSVWSSRFGGSAGFINKPYGPMQCPSSKNMMDKYGIPLGDYLDAVSEEFSSFHLSPDHKILKSTGHSFAELIYRYHAILYELC